MEKKFDFNEKDWILVRKKNQDGAKWDAYIYMYENKRHIYSLGGYPIDKDFNYIIPYEGNEHLLGTTDDCEEPYEPKKGDFIAFGVFKEKCNIGIFKELSWCEDEEGNVESADHEDYCNLDVDGELCLPDMEEDVNHCDGWVCDNMRPATEEEKQLLLDALHRVGKDWDDEKCEVVEYKWLPKYGEDYYRPAMIGSILTPNMERWLNSDYDNSYYQKGWVIKTIEECQALCDKLNEAIKNIK